MRLSDQGLIVILVVGVIAGWLAGKVVKGNGFGLVGDAAIGIVGALIGDWLLHRLGIHFGAGIIGLVINATIGAIVLAAGIAAHGRERVGRSLVAWSRADAWTDRASDVRCEHVQLAQTRRQQRTGDPQLRMKRHIAGIIDPGSPCGPRRAGHLPQ